MLVKLLMKSLHTPVRHTSHSLTLSPLYNLQPVTSPLSGQMMSLYVLLGNRHPLEYGLTSQWSSHKVCMETNS